MRIEFLFEQIFGVIEAIGVPELPYATRELARRKHEHETIIFVIERAQSVLDGCREPLSL